MSEITLQTQSAISAAAGRDARSRSGAGHPSGWYGVWLVVATEASLFAYLLFSYYYCLLQAPDKWPPDGPPSLTLASISTVILVASSILLMWAERSMKQGQTNRLRLGVGLALGLGAIFVAAQSYDWVQKSATISANVYGSFYVLATGIDIAHAVAGLVVLAALLFWSLAGRFDRTRYAAISIGLVYWNFTVIVWLCVFASFYLLPHVR